MGFGDRLKKAFGSNENKNGSSSRNFKYLDKQIHGNASEIFLDSDIVLGKSEERKYSTGIELDVDNIVINGNGHTMDGRQKARMFKCKAKNVTIKNMVFKNGFSDIFGSALLNTGELRIEDSTFVDNKVSQDMNHPGGGAVMSQGKLIIVNCKFLNNSSNKRGGAIHNMGELTISDSVFKNNTAEIGAAIRNEGEMTMSNSRICENVSPNNIIHNSQFVEIKNSEFSKNTGRIIHSEHDFSHLRVYDTVFSNNKSEFIITNFGNASLFNGQITENTIDDMIISNLKTFTIENTLFDANTFNNNPKNIENYGDLTLIAPKITDEGKTIINSENIFIRKLSDNLLDKIQGTGIVDTPEELIPKEEKHDFGYLDRIIHHNNSKEIVLMEDVVFEKYERDFYEGGIELDIDGLVIDGNGKTIDGAGESRIFCVTGKNILLKNIVFKNGFQEIDYRNQINNAGGCLRVNYDSSLTIENCQFLGNTSNKDGGAISNKGWLTVKDSFLSKNMAEKKHSSEGGAIHNCGELSIINCKFTYNDSKYFGGAIFSNGSLSIKNSEFAGNTSSNDGGVIYSNGNMEIEKTEFKNNSAESGGAIYCNSGDLKIILSEFNGNKVKSSGGALCIINRDEIANLKIDACEFFTNSAGGGGAIYNFSQLNINDSTFKFNRAKRDGGAIKSSSMILTLSDSTFIFNEAPNGGAIYCQHRKYLDVENCEFEDNRNKDIHYFSKIIDI
ncbi:right-handed parallel beta-helix repeat-containing protein [Methanobrevibacter millerae]|uniref:Polymorphic outer membrane protein repeat-containing protein n=1 Tax=Methanobrevibacter millerae TaxID=230361 RepID=A0A1G5VT42_9EURY|nr:right-handed parallel beta-helix repeat-containing protein [Methanobrevibacter millerae]SDA49019.1 polymorphic outer membrane protein repeat-containing protein [Methanobrevibacter millerae]